MGVGEEMREKNMDSRKGGRKEGRCRIKGEGRGGNSGEVTRTKEEEVVKENMREKNMEIMEEVKKMEGL